MLFGLTDHVEAPRDHNAADIYERVATRTILADQLGFDYAWFSEHHAHAHYGHLPAPLLLALHLASRTQRIRLGTAIICLNLHHPLDIAEQVAVADLLSGCRIAPGFGSGSTPEEYAYFGSSEPPEDQRHDRFAEALQIIVEAWSGRILSKPRRHFTIPPHDPAPVPSSDLPGRSSLSVT